MKSRIYWGLAILVVLLIGAFIFVIQKNNAELRQYKKELAAANKLLEERNKAKEDIVKHTEFSEDTSPPAEPGYKWVWHHNHWDRVPIFEVSDGQVTEVSEKTDQQPKYVRKDFSVEGEVDIAQLPDLPADIDPDEIPPFYVVGDSGIFHYNRSLTPEESDMYYTLKANPSYKDATPAEIKMSAIILVRQQREASGELKHIFQGIGDGSLTGVEARDLLDRFYERTR